MYYKEKCENGYWFFKHTLNGEWQPFTVEMLNKKIMQLENELQFLRSQQTSSLINESIKREPLLVITNPGNLKNFKR
jgi:hypothetical protein